MRSKSIFFLTFILVAVKSFSQQPDQYNSFLINSRQLIFVKTANAGDINGVMFLYERKSDSKAWKLFDSFAITVGRTGLAWDEFTKIPHNSTNAYKREGDGKSPAGLFKLGHVFSYHNMEKLKMPFQVVDSSDICVDDSKSSYYNKPVDTDTAKNKDWTSFENMHLKDGAYEYGVWVLYNSTAYTPGMGSCIFLHVWENDHSPTSGCTAMSKENILKLIHWLNEKKQPLLLQVTAK